MSNSLAYCFTRAFFGSFEDLDQRLDIEILQRRDHRQAADELGDQAEFQQILGLALAQHFADAALVGRATLAPKPIDLPSQAVADDLLEARERAAADEQDVGRVDLQEFLLRMLAPALRRHRGGGAFHQLEQRLLDALARHVAGDRWDCPTCG